MDGIKGDEGFSLYINFEKNSPNPGRVFRAAEETIKSFQQIDSSLVRTIDPGISSKFYLMDVEPGSLRIILRKALEMVDEDALKAGEWRKVIGHYLNEVRCLMITRLSDAEDVPSIKLLEDISEEIHAMAKDTDVRQLPDYSKLDHSTVADHLIRLSSAKAHLNIEDSMIYITPEKEVPFKLGTNIPRGYFEEVLIKETVSTPETMLIKVKKPDYLGNSQWQFMYEGHVMDAKMLDAEWLDDFQHKREIANPGDALRVRAIRHSQYGHDNEIIHTKFDIVKVVEVVEVISVPVQESFNF